MADIFVSYSQVDRDRVRPIVDALGSQGFSVWWDPVGAAGEDLDEMVLREIREASCVIVAWSTAAVESDWVKGEAEEARKQKKLISLSIDDAELPLRFGHGVRPDLSSWNGATGESEFQKLLKGVGAFVAPPKADSQLPTETGNQNAGRFRLWMPASALAVAVVITLAVWPDAEPEHAVVEPEDVEPIAAKPAAIPTADPAPPTFTLSVPELHLEDCQGTAPVGGRDEICLALVRNDAFDSAEGILGCKGEGFVCGKALSSSDEHNVNLTIDLKPGKNSLIAYEEDPIDSEGEDDSVCLERGPVDADDRCVEMGRIDFFVDEHARIMPGQFRLLSQAKRIDPVDINIEAGRLYETIFPKTSDGRYRILWNLEESRN